MKNDQNVKDKKIEFITSRCLGKTVLDIGCVQHNTEMVDNIFWVHKAIKSVASELIGLDYLQKEVIELNKMGYNTVHGDAENFDMGRKFDTIVAGDLIEHLNNYGNFLECCKNHMHQDSCLIITSANPWHWHKIIRACFNEVPVNFEHTCWMTPVCLSQLSERFGLNVTQTKYGSSRLKDSFLPVPKRLKHSSWYCELKLI